jgi:hypothetical protein
MGGLWNSAYYEGKIAAHIANVRRRLGRPPAGIDDLTHNEQFRLLDLVAQRDRQAEIEATLRGTERPATAAPSVLRAHAQIEAHRLPDVFWGNVKVRSAPTSADPGIAVGLQQAKLALAAVKGAQLADPDNGTDPVDKQILAKIEQAEAALDDAIQLQSKDGQSEPAATDDLTKA